jgi:amidase
MSCIGPMARSADDLALLYGIIAGPDGRDTEVQQVPADTVLAVELKNLRIAVAPTLPGLPVAAEVRAAVAALGQELARAGAQVEEAALPELDYHQDLASAGDLIAMMTGAFDSERREQPATLAQYLEALHRRDQSIIAWERFFEAWDVLLCPPSMTTAFAHCEPGTPLRVDGQEVVYWTVSAHATVFNYTGHSAVVQPYTQNGDGLPLGMQLVGRR